MLQDDWVYLVVGASGGTRIITATLQAIVDIADFNLGALAAVETPRIHHQLYPNTLQIEASFPSALQTGLRNIGHVVFFFFLLLFPPLFVVVIVILILPNPNLQIDLLAPGVTYSAVQLVKNATDGFLYGASDPRKQGQASAY